MTNSSERGKVVPNTESQPEAKSVPKLHVNVRPTPSVASEIFEKVLEHYRQAVNENPQLDDKGNPI